MCGIIGIASSEQIKQRDWLIHGRDAVTHRGPDNVGLWWSSDYRVGLGHRRLSIIDLTPAGLQPMYDYSETTIIVFNGEIYNYIELHSELLNKGYTFHSHSDTEVILAAYREWDINCLTRLNGMFAFAIYNIEQQTLFIARDRAGEKPLYYTYDNGILRFASELKGFLADKSFLPHIDLEALDLYLAVGYVPGDHCMIKGVKKLPPAHALSFDISKATIRVWSYWKLPVPPRSINENRIDEDKLLNELEDLLEDSVRRQMVADVPVGVLLSGGVDSSLVTAMAIRESDKVKTFTVGFKDFNRFDESEHARLVANYFGTEHIELKADKIGPELLPKLAQQFDDPIVDSSIIPTYLVSQLVRQHCKVALGGDGGDELFGGYENYDSLLWLNEKFGSLPLVLRKIIANAADALPLGFKGRYSLQALGSDLKTGLPMNSPFFDFRSRKKLLNGNNNAFWPFVAERVKRERVPSLDDLLQRATRMDFENYMVEDILVKIDRASMLNSLEIRAPLLDYRVIEFAFGRVPSQLKTYKDRRKILLKHLAAKLLPPGFDLQRKHGFSIPLANWLKKGPWRAFVESVLLDRQCLFNKNMIIRLIHGLDRGMYNQERLFGLVFFELWRREYGISL